MDEVLRKYFEELEQCSDLSNMDNELRFAEIVDKIALTRDSDAIPLLLRLFKDDNAGEDIAMQRLQHGIESFPISDYIPVLLTELKNIFVKASDSCCCFFYAIFNTEECLDFLKKNVFLADKETFLMLLDNMENDEPLERHKPIIAELRRLANA
jgi:hypothetical protein